MILHVDMDAFYASVEQRDNPALRGKPVIVGGSAQGRGVVSAASYEARQFGVHSAMPASQAVRLCPQGIFVKPRMQHYAAISKQIREIMFGFSSLVEPIALDEAFIDVSGSVRLFGPADSIARQIKQSIKQQTGLIASAGVAPNKYLAKVASDLDKPDGLVIVDPETINQFLDPLEITRIWGVGRACERKFAGMGVRTIGQLRALPLETLQRSFGVNAEHFWQLARGIDGRSVVPDRESKSVSHETTFHSDINQREILEAWLLELVDQVARRMRRYQIRGRTIQLKIRFSDFHTITRAQTLAEPTWQTRELWETAKHILVKALEPQHRPVRLLGAGVSNLSTREARQMTLFEEGENEKLGRLDSAADEIRDKFGSSAVKRAAAMEFGASHRALPRPENSEDPEERHKKNR